MFYNSLTPVGSFEVESSECIDYRCAKIGEWGDWLEWSSTRKCGTSTRKRIRNCIFK